MLVVENFGELTQNTKSNIGESAELLNTVYAEIFRSM